MDLIDSYDCCLQESFSHEIKLRKAINSFLQRNQLDGYVTRWIDDRLEISIAIPRSASVDFRGWVALDICNTQMCFRISVLKPRRRDTLYINGLLRSVMELNAQTRPYILKVHPATGELSIETTLLLDVLQLLTPNSTYLLDAINLEVMYVRQELLKTLILIEALRSSDTSPEARDSMLHTSLSLCKRYVTASTAYAWNVLEPGRQSGTNDTYSELKRAYRKIRPPEERENKLKFRRTFLDSACHPNICIEKLFQLSKPDDDEILENYVFTKPPLSSYDTIVSTLGNMPLGDLRSTSLLTHQNTKIRVRLTDRALAEREMYVASCLPPQRHRSLPKYFRLQEGQQDFILTEEVEGVRYMDYLRLNRTVLSTNTLLYMLADIARTLLYLRNNQTVYNNLAPANLTVSRALNVVFQDLSNAYHTSMKLAQTPNEPDAFSEPLNKLPYVSHQYLSEEYSFRSEKSDVFSFGLLMFKTLFRKSLFPLHPKVRFEKMLRKPVLAPENINSFEMDHFKLLAHFALRAASHNVVSPQELLQVEIEDDTQGDTKEKSELKGQLAQKRPYMDWLVVVTECVRAYFNNQIQTKSPAQQNLLRMRLQEEVDRKLDRQLNNRF